MAFRRRKTEHEEVTQEFIDKILDNCVASFDSPTPQETPCWVWQGALNTWGYGQTQYKDKQYRPHRAVYIGINGVSLEWWQQVNHLCDNRACCNPTHLFIGDHKSNKEDEISRGRAWHQGLTGRPSWRRPKVGSDESD